MKRWHLELKALSPILVGDRKPDAQYNESMEQIPGDRMRAAFARVLLAECPYFDSGAQRKDRQYWVEYQNLPACGACRWQAWCADFGEIQFEQATPGGTHRLPLTAMVCKRYGTAHGLVDTLVAQVVWQQRLREGAAGENWVRPRFRCAHSDCHGEGRMERKGGWFDPVSAKLADAPARTTFTRLQIDAARGVAAEGQLYTLRPLAEGVTFHLAIRAPELPPAPLTLSVGARTSSGLGRCAVTPVDAPVTLGVEARLERFRRVLVEARKAAGLIEPSGIYATITLRSPAYLPDLDADDPADLPNDASLQRLGLALGLPERLAGWSLEHAFTAYRFRGGWRLLDGTWSQPQHVLEAGSVLVVRGDPVSFRQAAQQLEHLETQGIGLRNTDGFGLVSVCDPYHSERAVTL